LDKLKSSYETLLKFSFLVQDEEQFSKETDSMRDQLQSFYISTKLGSSNSSGSGSGSSSSSSASPLENANERIGSAEKTQTSPIYPITEIDETRNNINNDETEDNTI
jgi:hypothetical protein